MYKKKKKRLLQDKYKTGYVYQIEMSVHTNKTIIYTI